MLLSMFPSITNGLFCGHLEFMSPAGASFNKSTVALLEQGTGNWELEKEPWDGAYGAAIEEGYPID